MTAQMYRPTPYEEAKNFWFWSDSQKLLTPEDSTASYVTRDMTENNETRIDLCEDLAWNNRRFFGYVGDFHESPSDNTATPYRVTLIGRISMMTGWNYNPQWHWVKVIAFSSNLLVAAPVPLLLGDLVTGIFAATYGGFMTAALDCWRPTDRDEWESLSPLPFPDHIHDIDFNEMTVKGLPSLGGAGFYYPGIQRITGARLAAPPQDPHDYHRNQRAKNEAALKGKEVTIIDPKETEEKRTRSQKRREGRDRSCARYERTRSQTPRGRSRKVTYLR